MNVGKIMNLYNNPKTNIAIGIEDYNGLSQEEIKQEIANKIIVRLIEIECTKLKDLFRIKD
jgi:hypothetical protein